MTQCVEHGNRNLFFNGKMFFLAIARNCEFEVFFYYN